MPQPTRSKSFFPKGKSLTSIAFTISLVAIVIALLSIVLSLKSPSEPRPVTQHISAFQTPEEQSDIYVRFDMEAFDQINEHYWMATSSYSLSKLFQTSLGKVTGSYQILSTFDREGTAKMLEVAFSNATSSAAKQKIAVDTVSYLMTYLLIPAGRSGLLTIEQNNKLSERVANINPANDLYKDVGTSTGASVEQVEVSYEKTVARLKDATSTEAKAELKRAEYTHKVLTSAFNKSIYDVAKAEPTLYDHKIGSSLYVHLKQISPVTFNEFVHAVDDASTTPGLNSLVIDLRGNFGGNFAVAQALLGLFIGQNQYAFDLFHQGNYEVQRTTMPLWPELSRYKEVAILIDHGTQSTAEELAASFKRNYSARIVGSLSLGWGTVESHDYEMKTIIDPNQKYIMELVEYLTLRPDNVPIEGSGVTPDVDISDKDWSSKLHSYFKLQGTIDTLDNVMRRQPID